MSTIFFFHGEIKIDYLGSKKKKMLSRAMQTMTSKRNNGITLLLKNSKFRKQFRIRILKANEKVWILFQEHLVHSRGESLNSRYTFVYQFVI